MEEGGTYGIELNSNYYFGTYEVVSGELLALIDTKTNTRRTYRYCKEDLSDEIVGMWVCNDGPNEGQNDMSIHTYNEDGTVVITGFAPDGSGFHNQGENEYKVVGNLMFTKVSALAELGINPYVCMSLVYASDATGLGDVLYTETYLPMNADGDVAEVSQTFLSIKQNLELENQKYDYIKTFVSNVKGEDKDIDFMGYTFNFAKMDGSGLDKMLKALLFAVEFPDANTLGYSYQMNGNKETYNSPIVVEGNKMTIKMSAKVPTLKDVVLYAFQDADCSQMHFYMHKTAFVSFYTNMQAMLMAATNEQFDITNAEAVNAIYDNINNAVETINVSLVMSK